MGFSVSQMHGEIKGKSPGAAYNRVWLINGIYGTYACMYTYNMYVCMLYKTHGSGKLHQLLENPTCTPMSTVYPLQIRSVFVFVVIRV